LIYRGDLIILIRFDKSIVREITENKREGEEIVREGRKERKESTRDEGEVYIYYSLSVIKMGMIW
jgi:hypothetical protein